MTTLFVNTVAVLLIIFILWWFFGSRPKAQRLSQDDSMTILVKDGVYEPAFIRVPAAKKIKLNFIRKDATPCAESVLFSSLDLAYQLPLNKKIEIIIPPQPSGEITFTCQMGMYRGKIVVE